MDAQDMRVFWEIARRSLEAILPQPRQRLAGWGLCFVTLPFLVWFPPALLVEDPAVLGIARWGAGLGVLSGLGYYLIGRRIAATDQATLRRQLERLSLRQRTIFEFALSVGRNTVWLPLGDDAVNDLEHERLIVSLGVSLGRREHYEVPPPVWNYLCGEWQGRLTPEEQARREVTEDLTVLHALNGKSGRRVEFSWVTEAVREAPDIRSEEG